MPTLEEAVYDNHELIKVNTLKSIKAGKPLQYMINVALVGERDYNVPFNDSFWYAVNVSLDHYNNKPEPKTVADMFYSIKYGTEQLLYYCFDNYYDPDEGYP